MPLVGPEPHLLSIPAVDLTIVITPLADVLERIQVQGASRVACLHHVFQHLAGARNSHHPGSELRLYDCTISLEPQSQGGTPPLLDPKGSADTH